MKISELKRDFVEDVLTSFVYKKKEKKIILRVETAEMKNEFCGPSVDPKIGFDNYDMKKVRFEFFGVKLIKKTKFLKHRAELIDWIKPVDKDTVSVSCYDDKKRVCYSATFKSTGFTFKYIYLPKKKQIELAKQGKLFYK